MKTSFARVVRPLVIVPMLLACGCDAAVVVSTGPSTVTPLLGTTWEATDVDGVVAIDPRPTLTFDSDQQVSGWSGCGRYVADLRPSSGSGMVRMGGVQSTRPGCDPGVRQREGRFINALNFVVTRRVDNSNRLRFLDGSGRTLLTFQKL